MILCRNGHENPDGATYCVVCKVYIDSTVQPIPPPEPPPVPPSEPEAPSAPPAVALSPARLGVTPGGEARCELQVANVGGRPEAYVVEVEGEVASWTSVEPSLLSLAPGAAGAARLTLRPPPTVPPGTSSFEVAVFLGSDPATRATSQGVLDVTAPEPSPPLSAELEPRVSRGRTSAQHLLRLANPARAPLQATLSAGDAEGVLAFDIDPPEVTVPSGGAATATLRVRARKRLLLRNERERPFEVIVVPAGAQMVSIEATFVQTRFVPLLLVPVAGFMLIVTAIAVLLVLLAIALVLYAILS